MSAEIISSPDQGSDQSRAPLVPLLLPVAAEHVIRLIRTKVAASLAERRAIPPFVALIEELGHTATTEFAAKWPAGIREDLGPEIAGRLIALHKATLGAISTVREDNPKEQQQLPADSDIQADWARAGAVMQAQIEADGVEQQVEDIRRTIAHLDRTPPADRARRLPFLRHNISILDVDPATRAQLLAVLATASTAGDPSTDTE
jgi:hypothetical protein